MKVELPQGINIDAEMVRQHLVKFIKDVLNNAGFSRLIVGISGGLDSAVVAYLAVEAIGAKNVTGVILPYKSSDPENIKDARLIIDKLKIASQQVDISPMVDAYFMAHPTEDRNRRGNKMARERMSVLYDLSAEYNALVIGTSNRSEIKMGYGTLYGDLACALNPLGNLFKTQVRQLAKHLEIPERIITKPPSADLWVGQTDEGELGLTYEMLDTFLYYYVDLGYTEQKLEEMGFAIEMINRLKRRIAQNEFKGCPPIIAELP